MARLVVLQTSPRLPAGLLSRAAWQALAGAAVVAAGDLSAPLPTAVAAQGVDVTREPDVSVDRLLRLAEAADVVWLLDQATEEHLLRGLADEAVRRTERGGGGPDIEVLVGSFDPVGARLLDLVEVMDRLRLECPWDREQTHESLVHYLLEETYETVEAVETGDRDHLREELGDLLLQVMFHARIGAEHPERPFTIDDVAGGIVDKLVRRHPHVFAGTEVSGAGDVETNWEAIKAAEKARTSALEGIPLGLPALSLAHKVVARAQRAGVPLSELAGHLAAARSGGTAFGDRLLRVVLEAEAAGVDPEQALRQRLRDVMADVQSYEQRALADQAQQQR